MKPAIFILILLFAANVFGQKIITNPTQEETIFIPNVTVIPDKEWGVMINFLKTENWDRSAFYASGLMRRLKADNDKKQIAQLRYFYLFSLAGKILKFHDAGKTSEKEAVWAELDKAVNESIGKEFILPPREYRSSCNKNLNFICPVENNEKAFRTAATNKEATAIHSFDYVMFDKKIDLSQYADKQIFLGGTLKKVEFNDDLTEPWVMYLIFEKGFVRVVVEE
jgi:hypothetical protein